MHTFVWKDPETEFEIRVHHNGDMSGDARIVAPKDLVGVCTPGDPESIEVHLPAKLLAAVGRHAALEAAIDALEELREES